MARKLTQLLEKHVNCRVQIVETPGRVHYGKICCETCGNHRGSLFLKWLDVAELQLVGHYTTTEQIQAAQQLKQRLLKKNKNNRPNTNTQWSQATEKERNFYRSYQPPGTLTRTKTPAQMIGDRLCVAGHSKYNGNSIYSIPTNYLKQLLTSGKIKRKEEQALILAAIDLQTGSHSAPPSK
jgi:hypothetical protein